MADEEIAALLQAHWPAVLAAGALFLLGEFFKPPKRRNGGSFFAILRCFPLPSVRMAAEKRLVWRKNPSPFGIPLV